MRRMNCRSVRRELEEMAPGEVLSSVAGDHIKNCVECGTFREKHLKLQKLVSSLGTVEAPGDFDFRLRARLADEKRGSAWPFAMRNLSVGFRSTALVTVLLLIGSALLFLSLRTSVDNPQLSGETKLAPSQKEATASAQAGNDGQQSSGTKVASGPNTTQPDVTSAKLNSFESPTQRRTAGHRLRPEQVATIHEGIRDGERQRTRDLSSTQAAVFRPTDQLAQTGTSPVFPIDASYQSLKLSFDDGRGSARTISLPKVSFGSQRVLAQGASSSPRGSW
jgi:hypothetical protein